MPDYWKVILLTLAGLFLGVAALATTLFFYILTPPQPPEAPVSITWSEPEFLTPSSRNALHLEEFNEDGDNAAIEPAVWPKGKDVVLSGAAGIELACPQPVALTQGSLLVWVNATASKKDQGNRILSVGLVPKAAGAQEKELWGIQLSFSPFLTDESDQEPTLEIEAEPVLGLEGEILLKQPKFTTMCECEHRLFCLSFAQEYCALFDNGALIRLAEPVPALTIDAQTGDEQQPNHNKIAYPVSLASLRITSTEPEEDEAVTLGVGIARIEVLDHCLNDSQLKEFQANGRLPEGVKSVWAVDFSAGMPDNAVSKIKQRGRMELRELK